MAFTLILMYYALSYYLVSLGARFDPSPWAGKKNKSARSVAVD
jgi:hypothetical protein